MENDHEPPLSVSAIRERLERQNTERGVIRLAPGPPPLPPHHRRNTTANVSVPLPLPTSTVPIPNGRPKPLLAPKPSFMCSMERKGSAPVIGSPPLVCLSTPEGDIERPRRESIQIEEREEKERNEERLWVDDKLNRFGTIRERAKAFDRPFGVSFMRPASTISSSSMTSRDTDVVEAREDMSFQSETDSDTDMIEIHEINEDKGERNHEMLMKLKNSLNIEHRISDRRQSTASTVSMEHNSTSQLIHEKIMGELMMKGLLRKSLRVTNNNGTNDVVRTREERKNQTISLPLPSCSSDGSSSSPRDSTSSGRHSTVSADYVRDERNGEIEEIQNIEDTVKDYTTGDEKEDKRLKKLHYAALEFYTVQVKFVKYLNDMGRIYPGYVAEYGRRMGGKDLLAPLHNGLQHPVIRLQSFLLQMLPVHEELLKSFRECITKWDSQQPDMATILLTHADFLKVCKPFIKAKKKLLDDLTELRSNSDFTNATTCFEEKVFRRGVGAVTQQLDQVHQNFLRYKILMMSYDNYLLEGSAEKTKTKETILRLEKIAQSVNADLDVPSDEQLFKLYDRFQGQFNVFTAGRRLLKQGEVMKQTRKEPQPRFLVLFSDVLWVCREATGLGSAGLFDMTRSYDIPLEMIATKTESHDDYENQLFVVSKKKSFLFIMKSLSDRRSWENDIRNAVESRKGRTELITKTIRERRESIAAAGIADLKAFRQAHENEPPSPPDVIEESETEGKQEEQDDENDESYLPAWIPDDASTHCMMDGCDTVFGLLNRRHHCRDCGWLICSNCAGRAPIAKLMYQKEMVCPECYERIEQQYRDGILFPEAVLQRDPSDPDVFKVKVEKGKPGKPGYKTKVVFYDPGSLFLAPINRRLKRVDVNARIRESQGLVFGKIYLRIARGKESIRHAQLTDGMVLKLYLAPFDREPSEQHVIYGFELKEYDSDNGCGRIFELRHRNQFRTDRREEVVCFRVESTKSSKKWSSALRKGLGLPEEE